MLNDILKAKKNLFADGVQTVLRGQENRNRRVVFLQGNLQSVLAVWQVDLLSDLTDVRNNNHCTVLNALDNGVTVHVSD